MKQINLPDFVHSLQDKDLGHLRIVAQAWGIEFNAPNLKEGLNYLSSAIQDKDLLDQVINELTKEAKNALLSLVYNQGRIPWAVFVRRFGNIREMGPGRRDRDRPDIFPVSASEVLWYRALIGRAFFDGEKGPEEFAFIPVDIFKRLPQSNMEPQIKLGKVAPDTEITYVFSGHDMIVDHACTILAGKRAEIPEQELKQWINFGYPDPILYNFLEQLLVSAGLIDKNGLPDGDAVREFLELPRMEAHQFLIDHWITSKTVNELRLVPGLSFDGKWENDPSNTRRSFIELMLKSPDQVPSYSDVHQAKQSAGSDLHRRPFISLPAFVAAVKDNFPDFQRPAGDYDSWFIRDKETGKYLRGFENWDLVDGKLLAFMICGPLNWLGLVDLAGDTQAGETVRAFRLSSFGDYLYQGSIAQKSFPEAGRWQVYTDGSIVVPRLSSRPGRYLLSRFSDWISAETRQYRYALTLSSLRKAKQQNLQIAQLLALMKKFADNIPPSLVKGLERWNAKGNEVQIEQLVVLRVKSPEILEMLRTSRAARFLGDPLGKYAVTIHKGAVAIILEVLAEGGILGEADIEE